MSYTFWPSTYNDESVPSLNVANGNAHVPAHMMGCDLFDYSIPCEKLESVLLKLKIAYAPTYVRETTEGRFGGKGANVVFCGLPEERIEQYRSTLIKIVEFCIEHNTPIVWG